MDDKRLELRISSDLLAQVDRARGEVKRAAWVKDALRKALPVAALADERFQAVVAAVSAPLGAEEAPLAKGCPECGTTMTPQLAGRWVCGDCGWTR